MFSGFNLYDLKLYYDEKLLFLWSQAQEGERWWHCEIRFEDKRVSHTFWRGLNWVLFSDINYWTVSDISLNPGHNEFLGKPLSLRIFFSGLLEQCISDYSLLGLVRVSLVRVHCIVVVSVDLNSFKDSHVSQHHIWSRVLIGQLEWPFACLKSLDYFSCLCLEVDLHSAVTLPMKQVAEICLGESLQLLQ